MPNRRGKRKNRRSKGARNGVPEGASLVHHPSTGLITRLVFQGEIKITTTRERFALNYYSEATVSLWGSYRIVHVDLEFAPGTLGAFRVWDRVPTTQESAEKLFVDAGAVISASLESRRQVHRYRPAGAVYRGWQERIEQNMVTGLQIDCVMFPNSPSDILIVRYHVDMTDQRI